MPVSLVLGASGAIGRFLLPRLRAANHRVLALSRTPHADSAAVHWLVGDLYAGMPALPPLDAIFSLGPLDGLARWLPQAHFDGQPRLVAFGSMSIDSKRDSPDAAERALAERLQAAEWAVIDAANERGLSWTVLRPTLIYGAGLDRSLTPIARFGSRWRVFPLLPGARGLRQPVHADDLAAACLDVFDRAKSVARIYPLGGGERLAFAHMLDRVRASLACATVPLPLSRGVLRAALATGCVLRGRHPAAAGIARLDVDLVADDAAARADFGWTPRMFRPDAACWSTPMLP